MQGNWVHLVVLIIFVGFSVISWIYRQLKEQAEKKRMKDLIEERQRELLRTGRDPAMEASTVAPAAPPVNNEEERRRREIAARRESQLAELRRRAQVRQQSQPSVPRSIPGSPGTTVPQRRAEATPPARTPQARTPQARTPQIRTQQPPKPQRVTQQNRSQPMRPKPAAAPMQVPRAEPYGHEGESSTHRLVPEELASRRSAVIVAGVPSTPEEWRRAIIANEILSPSLAMRSGQPPLPF